MKIRELYERLNETIPPSLSCEWDNDGRMVCPDGEKEVRRVLVTLDVTEGAVDRAVEGAECGKIHHCTQRRKGAAAKLSRRCG